MQQYINKFTKTIADDTCQLISSKNHNDIKLIAKTELASLKKWTDTNRLIINSDKSNFIIVNPKLRFHISKSTLTDNNSPIKKVVSTKYLRVELDNQLNFLPHIFNLEIKLSRNVGVLNKLKHYLRTSTHLSLYYAIIIISSFIIWNLIIGNYPNSQLYKIQVLHNKAIRATCHVHCSNI